MSGMGRVVFRLCAPSRHDQFVDVPFFDGVGEGTHDGVPVIRPDQIENRRDFSDRLIAVVGRRVGHLPADLAALVHEEVVSGSAGLAGDCVKKFPEKHAEAVDVKAEVRPHGGFIHLFGGRILGSVDLEVIGIADRAGTSEIDQEELAEVVEYEVGRLDVPVDQSLLVYVVKEQGNLEDDMIRELHSSVSMKSMTVGV